MTALTRRSSRAAVAGHPTPWLLASCSVRARWLAAVIAVASVCTVPSYAQALIQPAPVVVWNRQITVLRAKAGNVTPSQRATNTVARVKSLPHELLDQPVEVMPAEIGPYEGFLVMVGETPVIGLLPDDADLSAGQTAKQAAAEAAENLRAVLAARIQQRSVPLLLRSIGLSLLATLAFAGFVWAFVRLERLLLDRLARHPVSVYRRASLWAYLRSHAVQVGLRLANAIAWAFGLFIGYGWLTFVLSEFPYTEPWGNVLGKRLFALATKIMDGIFASLPGLVAVAIIFALTRVVLRLLHALLESMERGVLALPWIQQDTIRATRRIINVVAWLFAVVVAYPYVPGSQSVAFKGVSVLVGLMLSLGSTGLVNQLMSGLAVAYSRSMRIGEYVCIGDVEGTVVGMGFLSTKLRTYRKEEITIPNAVVTNANTINYSRLADSAGGVVVTSVTIGYEIPWRQVHALLQSAAERTPDVRADPAPRVFQRALGDFCVEYELQVNVDRPSLRRETLALLHAQIQDAFNEAGVQIMSPHYVAQPENPVVVPVDRPKAAPSQAGSPTATPPRNQGR